MYKRKSYKEKKSNNVKYNIVEVVEGIYVNVMIKVEIIRVVSYLEKYM